MYLLLEYILHQKPLTFINTHAINIFLYSACCLLLEHHPQINQIPIWRSAPSHIDLDINFTRNKKWTSKQYNPSISTFNRRECSNPFILVYKWNLVLACTSKMWEIMLTLILMNSAPPILNNHSWFSDLEWNLPSSFY